MSVSRRSGINPNPTDQYNLTTDVILPCHVLNFAGIQKRTLMQPPNFIETSHESQCWLCSAYIFPLCRTDQSISSFPSVTSSTHGIQVLRSHTPLPVQLATEMDLLRVACRFLLLNLTMNSLPQTPVLPLHESHDRRACNHKPFCRALAPKIPRP
jgi:hypothetical protein